MRQRQVVLSPEAEGDLLDLYNWIAGRAGSGLALSYIERVEDFCGKLDLASERGQLRDDIRKGLRIVGFERNLLIAFTVEVERVVVLRVFSGGRNWEESF